MSGRDINAAVRLKHDSKECEAADCREQLVLSAPICREETVDSIPIDKKRRKKKMMSNKACVLRELAAEFLGTFVLMVSS